VGVTVCALLLAEGALRLFGVASAPFAVKFLGQDGPPEGTVPDPDLLWRRLPEGGHDPIHETGIRGDLFSPRAGRDLRILCVGDSCTFGLAVLMSEGWGHVLDRRIQARLPDACVETALAAAPGYTTHQDLALVRRHAGLLRADVTILYVGAWNDLLPAAGLRDSEFSAALRQLSSNPFWSTRLGRLLWRSLHPIPTAEEMRKRLEHASVADQSVAARVSLPEFCANVRELVAYGQASGAVLAVVPSASTGRRLHWTTEYRRALRNIYRERGVRWVELDEVFPEYLRRHEGEGLTATDLMDTDDEIHPSPLGYQALAEALEPLVLESAAGRVAEMRASPVRRPRIDSIEPRVFPAGRPVRLRVVGEGFAEPGGVRRVLVGDRIVREVRPASDTTFDVEVLPEASCRPGPVHVEVRTSGGASRFEGLEVLPFEPEVTVREERGRLLARFTIRVEAALAAQAWIAPESSEEGKRTSWGTFRLEHPGRFQPDRAVEDRYSLKHVDLPRIDFSRFASGDALVSGEVPLPEPLGRDGAPLYAQVLVRWGKARDAAWLSDVIRVTR
jgi:lysophospholipase L1-like esterase